MATDFDKLKTEDTKSFPAVISGNRVVVKLHDVSDKHLHDVVEVETRNSDFTKYFCRRFSNKQVAQEYIEMTHELFKTNRMAEYGIFLKDNTYIGGIAFEYLKAKNMLSIIYFLDKNFRNKGYLSEALHIAEKEMFRRGFINLLLKIDRNNIPSQRVAKSNNYVLKDSVDDILSFIKSSKSND